jgi:Leucine-rich repeat (LRR) protein
MNSLVDVPRDLDLKNLVSLHAEGNSMSELPQGFLNCEKLRVLDVSRNAITSIPRSIGRLKQLTFFNISLNALSFIPPEIGLLRSIDFMDLSANQLTFLPREIGGLISIKDFRCQSNNIRDLPIEMKDWSNLTVIQMSHNLIEHIPTELFIGWSKLHSIGFGSNRLQEIPREIGVLTKLQAAGFVNNRITSIPSEIGLLKHLAALNVGDNLIESVPDSIVDCTNLTAVYLYGNRLETLPEAFGTMPRLNGVYANNNPLRYLPYKCKYIKSILNIDSEAFISIEDQDTDLFRKPSNPLSLKAISARKTLEIYGTKWLTLFKGNIFESRNYLPPDSPFPQVDLSVLCGENGQFPPFGLYQETRSLDTIQTPVNSPIEEFLDENSLMLTSTLPVMILRYIANYKICSVCDKSHIESYNRLEHGAFAYHPHLNATFMHNVCSHQCLNSL